MDFGIVYDRGPITGQCTELTCQGVMLVEWNDLLAYPICGKTCEEGEEDDYEQQLPLQTVRYGATLNRKEGDTQIVRIDNTTTTTTTTTTPKPTSQRQRQKLRKSFDDNSLFN
jgi:hypothetical protein